MKLCFSERTFAQEIPRHSPPGSFGRAGRLALLTAIAAAASLQLRAMPLTPAPVLKFVGQSYPAIYNSDGTPRLGADGQPVTSPRLVDLEFANPLVNPAENTKVRVLLPANYETSSTRYPVLYLLHGAKTGNLAKGEQYEWWTRWASEQNLFDFTAQKDVVVVMPTGGALSFYSDWFNGGEYGPPQWETFHLDQLISYIESHFRVRADRGGRVIAGVSMGGFGAMCYAARHPDLFAGVYSFSGALNNLAFAAAPTGTPSLVSERIWGPFSTEEIRWRAHNPIDLAANLSPLTVWFRTATGVPHESTGSKPPPNDTERPVELAMEARVLPLNEQFHAVLQQSGITHTYLVEPVGGHTGYHFVESLFLAWPSIESDFKRSVIPPERFNFRSIDSHFRVWGWEFTIQRDVVEFLTLSNVTARSLTAQGSGSLGIKTPPIYHPNQAYTLNLKMPSGEVAVEKTNADGEGHLNFSISLGKSHPFQQFTPAQKAAEAEISNYWNQVQVLISP